MTPDRIFMRVLLPAPFSPTTACNSPARTSNETSLRATTPGKRLVTFSMAISGGMAALGTTRSGGVLSGLRRFVVGGRRRGRRGPPGATPVLDEADQQQQDEGGRAGDPADRGPPRNGLLAEQRGQDASQQGQVDDGHQPQRAGEEALP